MKILLINAHPDYTGTHGTNELLAYAKETIQGDVVVKNIYDVDENVHPITKDMMDMWMGVNPDSEQHKLMREQQTLILNEWIEADAVMIFSPLHNLGITSKLKDYFDNVLIANQTFKYTANGPVGLLDNSKKVAYIQVSGSSYTNDINYIHLDLAPLHVRTLLNFMGISQMSLIRAEGMNLDGADSKAIFDEAKQEIKQFIENNQLYK